MKLQHRTMPSDLAILNAEHYIDTAGLGKSGKAKKSHSSQAEEGPRKRAKTSSVAVEVEALEDGDEKSKRARGRPRLDTKDQTAAEVGSLHVSLIHSIVVVHAGAIHIPSTHPVVISSS